MTRKTPPKDSGKKIPRKGRPLMVWVDDDIGVALDRFIAEQRARPKITTVVELALQEFLNREGYYPLASTADSPQRHR